MYNETSGITAESLSWAERGGDKLVVALMVRSALARVSNHEMNNSSFETRRKTPLLQR
jgi:hypothetical protein